MKSQQKKKDVCQADICNLSVFSPILAEVIITSPSKMNTQEGGWKSIQCDTKICEAI